MKELRRLSDSELAEHLRNAREELFDAKFKLATRQLKNYRGLRASRLKIARLLTMTREREREARG